MAIFLANSFLCRFLTLANQPETGRDNPTDRRSWPSTLIELSVPMRYIAALQQSYAVFSIPFVIAAWLRGEAKSS
jgi:hypothetical protein